MKKYIWTIILHSCLTASAIHGQVTSVFYTSKSVECMATVSQVNQDTVFVISPDTCTHTIFDTIFNGVYVFRKIPSNNTTAIRSFKNKKLDGQQIEYFASGQIRLYGFAIKNRAHGKWTHFYTTGEVSYVAYYKKGKEKAIKYFDKTGKAIGVLEYLKLMD